MQESRCDFSITKVLMGPHGLQSCSLAPRWSITVVGGLLSNLLSRELLLWAFGNTNTSKLTSLPIDTPSSHVGKLEAGLPVGSVSCSAEQLVHPEDMARFQS